MMGNVQWKRIDWEEVEREYAETLGQSINDADLQKMADDTLESLRECLLPQACKVDILLSRG